MVKKTAQAIPNQLLRRARLERGWTQQVVADRIGAPNDMMVTRWERGKAFPSPYYVERLCQLFGLKASDLGLLKESPPLASSQPLKSSQPQSQHHSSQDPAGKKASPIPSPPRNAPTSPLSYLPLIGREADARTLKEIYQTIQQRQKMQVVTIQGEAGIGKTHLASAFLSWASMQGATLLQGRAFEMGGRLPYQPLVHALSPQLEAEPVPETLLSATWLSELSRILPQLHERYPHLPVVQGDETTARIRLFEAVTRLLQAFCEQAPVVLFIDDVHWADAASLDVLHYAGQRWSESGTPLLLLLSLRSEVLATVTPLSRWLSGLHRDLPVTNLTLGPWTQDETLDLLAALTPGHTIGTNSLDHLAELGQWLFRETRGQPFYLVETLNVLLERQILTFHHSLETYAEGVAQGQRALEHARRAGDMRSRRGIASHLYLSHICQHGGDPAQMFSESCLAVKGAELLGDGVYQYLGYGLRGWAEGRLGQPAEGMQSMERAQAASQQLGGQLLFHDTFAAVRAELLLAAGQVEKALAHAEAVVALANEVGGVLSAGLAQRVWGQALARLERWEEAEAHLTASWQTLLSGENLLEAARTQVSWGSLCCDRGDRASAQEHFEQAAAQFEASGLTRELATVQSDLAQLGHS